MRVEVKGKINGGRACRSPYAKGPLLGPRTDALRTVGNGELMEDRSIGMRFSGAGLTC